MSSDLFALNALAKELDTILYGAKIEKIVQPETDEIRFFVRALGKSGCLVASCNSQAPRCHMTEVKKVNPVSAPSFCMLLRKYLSSASFGHVSIFNQDRILRFELHGRTEMKDDATFFLFVEIMSRYSNIVFTDGDMIILDAIKRIPLDVEKNRVVMHGVKYEAVEQSKTSYLSTSFDFLNSFCGGDLHQFILDNISGFSSMTVSELIARAGLMDKMPSLTKSEIERLANLIKRCRNIDADPMYCPSVINGKDVAPIDYSLLIGKCVKYPTMNAAYDDLCSRVDGDLRQKNRLRDLVTATKRFKTRVEKRIVDDKTKLADCENMNQWRVYGDMVINNIYRIKKGDKSVRCIDYIDGHETDVPLDLSLTPSANAKAFYSKYNKLKRTKDFLNKKIKEDEATLEYVQSIEEELAALPERSPSNAIEEELISIGAIYAPKNVKTKIRKEKTEPPTRYLIEGFVVLCGRNNVQNDELTFKTASSDDVWLHLKNSHGMHTIIFRDGKDVPPSVIKTAAEITASNKTAKCEVDYTERKNVRRMPGGHPGLVNYQNYKTVIVAPNAHLSLLAERQ